ncbi:Uncharacterized protein OBRU01_16034 [Operophtera brumata]|uniref:Ig-like domain-containing protein n=1 Tax=Operophtera brumata TaxID=104452 RepID=A0A0L7L116_OPEBR|nr:Uncharacterized protein OBRU01_16034 [Operophtera brumata]
MQAVARLWLLALLPALAGDAGWLAAAEVVSAGAEGGARGAGPSFAPHQRVGVLAATGQGATLACHVLRLGDQSVSWVRSRDLHILSHAGTVFTADARVSATETRGGAGGGSSHALHIERLRTADGGRYECQVNTDPKLSLFFNLTVLDEPMPTVTVSALGAREVRALGPGARGVAPHAARDVRTRSTHGADDTLFVRVELPWRRLAGHGALGPGARGVAPHAVRDVRTRSTRGADETLFVRVELPRRRLAGHGALGPGARATSINGARTRRDHITSTTLCSNCVCAAPGPTATTSHLRRCALCLCGARARRYHIISTTLCSNCVCAAPGPAATTSHLRRCALTVSVRRPGPPLPHNIYNAVLCVCAAPGPAATTSYLRRCALCLCGARAHRYHITSTTLCSNCVCAAPGPAATTSYLRRCALCLCGARAHRYHITSTTLCSNCVCAAPGPTATTSRLRRCVLTVSERRPGPPLPHHIYDAVL